MRVSQTCAAPGSQFGARNNFDLIRLLAAVQVMLKHGLFHLGFNNYWTEILGIFPGVPVFFFISGYLIFQSHNNCHSLSQFSVNRLLRIYPALVVCFIVSVAIVIITGYLPWQSVFTRHFFAWAAAQLTVGQIYNPEFMRGFGVGVINGSLWTIAVELQFYLLTPVLAWLTLKQRHAWIVVLILGVIANLANPVRPEGFTAKLYSVSFPPWLYMFALGAWLSTRRDLQARLLTFHPAILLAAYLLSSAAGYFVGLRVTGNEINPLSFVILAMLVFRLTYTCPSLSEKLLHRNDISYGIYIYHMPAINVVAFYGFIGASWALFAACLTTIAMAVASWRWIEKPSLQLKKLALRNY